MTQHSSERSIYSGLFWEGEQTPPLATAESLTRGLMDLEAPLFLLQKGNDLYCSNQGTIGTQTGGAYRVLAASPAILPSDLGDASFNETYGTRYPLYAGSMASAIASEDLVIALGKAGFMGSFGAGGLLPARIEKAIDRIQAELGDKPYLFNLISSPFEPAVEAGTMDLYIRRGIHAIEASAFINITPQLVWYRLAGLSTLPDGSVSIANRMIAKVSRKEIAQKFMQPAEEKLVSRLLLEGKISEEQARLAQFVPLADDITVEADSGGHTDNRPLVTILPAIIQLRDQIQEKFHYSQPVRVGAAGGIATPEAALAALMMGAAYVVTGSINQATLEAGTSAYSKNLLAQMEFTDSAMAPASDMFEMGVNVQVLKRGTMFVNRAKQLYETYIRYGSIEEIPVEEREKLESTIFQQSLEEIWEECLKFFGQRDPKQIERALQKPKYKMALIFRWYLGLSSRWAVVAEKGREMDYQIWTGPAMGAFNDWVRGSYLEDPGNRRVADVSAHLMTGTAYLLRERMLEAQGITLPETVRRYIPAAPLV